MYVNHAKITRKLRGFWKESWICTFKWFCFEHT